MEHFLLTLGLIGLPNHSILMLLNRFTPPHAAEPSLLRAWLIEAKGRYRWLRIPDLDELNRVDEAAAMLLAKVRSQGLAVHGLLSPSYPSQLKGIKEAPVLLYTQGELKVLEQTGIAVVGTRHLTEQGQNLCDQFTEQIVAGGFTVISSLEMGIDSRVHLRSLALGGRNVGVLGCAHDQLSTQRQQNLAEAILAAGGCLVSMHPPGSRTSPGRVDDMHRLIAGLCRGMILIEPIGPGGSDSCLGFGRRYGRRLAFASEGPQNLDEYELMLNPNDRLIAAGRAEALCSVQEAERWLRGIASIRQD